MKVILDWDEIQKILIKEMNSKTDCLFGEADEDSSYFKIKDSSLKEIEVGSIEFVGGY